MSSHPHPPLRESNPAAHSEPDFPNLENLAITPDGDGSRTPSDLEASSTGLDEKDLKAEQPDADVEVLDATELTPMEAFKWDVDGDQSPCECYSLYGYIVDRDLQCLG
jgi:hypothetical protein